MKNHSFHVVIIGGGLGGLCLAQGLNKAGISVQVYERDRTPDDRLQGYRIHIDPHGSRALHSCLPKHLFDAFVATCGRSGSSFSMYTEQMKRLVTFYSEADLHSDGIGKHRSVSRMTLRQVLLSDLEGIVHFNKKFVRYEEQADGKVSAFFEDGTSATGDILVAADGGNSRVRAQFLPHAERVDTGILTVMGKLALTDQTRSLLPEPLYDGPASIMGPKGTGMFVAVQEFSQSGRVPEGIGGNDESYASKPNLLFDNTQDYIMWAYIARQEKYSNAKPLAGMTNADLKREVQQKIKGWSKNLETLVDLSGTETILPVPIRSSVPIQPWKTRRITLVGDAIHSMTPFRGIGGNIALRDAELLCSNLIAAHRREKTVLQGIQDYETEMIKYGFDAVRSSRKAAEQSVKESPIGLMMMKAVFRTIHAVTSLKRRIFSNPV